MNPSNLRTIHLTRQGVRALLLALLILGLMAVPGPVHASEAPPDYVGEWGISANEPGQLLRPLGLEIHNGQVYVADLGNARIQIFDNSGNLANHFGSAGTGNGQFIGIYDVAVDSQGNIYAADVENDRIQKFDSAGNFQLQWSIPGTDPNLGDGPSAVVVDSNDDLFVLAAGQIFHYDANGGLVNQWLVQGGFGILAIDTGANLYSINPNAREIYKYSPSGSQLATFSFPHGSGPGELNSPTDLAVDETGRIYVMDQDNGRIQIFDATGAYVGEWGTQGSGDEQIGGVFNIAYADGQIYLSDYLLNRIQVFDTNGTFLSLIDRADGRFVVPSSIDVDASGTVFVMDRGDNRLQRFDDQGNFLSLSLGYNGWGFGGSETLAVAADGSYVVGNSSGNDTVLRFAADDSYVDQITLNSDSDNVTGMDMDAASNIYVAKRYGIDLIVKLASDGSQEWAINSTASPNGLAVAPDGSFYITSFTSGAKVRHFSADGVLIAEWGDDGTGPGQFSHPRGVDVDADGHVYVTDTGSNRVQKFASDGTFLAEWGGPGSGPGQFDDPVDIAIHGREIYVVDQNNQRVQHFRIPNTAPRADSQFITTAEDTPIALTLTGADAENDALTFTVTGGPAHGSLSGSGASLTYTPNADFHGGDSFTFVVSDGQLTSAPATVDITATPVNDNPQIGLDQSAVSVDEGQPIANRGSLLDVDGDSLSLSASVGMVIDTGDGSWRWSFSPADGPNDSQPVTITANDGQGGSASVTFDLTVNNLAPTASASADRTTIFRGESVTLNGSWIDPAGAADERYTWRWDITGDGAADADGSAAYGEVVGRSATFSEAGEYTLTFAVGDKDGAESSASVTITVHNQEPVCADAQPSVATLWPPDHQLVDVSILGITDPEDDGLTTTITGIIQDEPVNGNGDGNTGPDGQGVGTSTAQVRAERNAAKKNGGNGRVYHISFQADDGYGGLCEGTVLVSVPKSRNRPAVDDGPLYDATLDQE